MNEWMVKYVGGLWFMESGSDNCMTSVFDIYFSFNSITLWDEIL